MDKKIVAAYCRTAHADDLAIELQKATLIRYAEEHGYNDNIIFYVDNGCSGINSDRLAFQKLNQDIADGKVKAVIVRSLSRIGRDTEMLLKWIRGLREKSISLLSVSDPDETYLLDMLLKSEEVESK